MSFVDALDESATAVADSIEKLAGSFPKGQPLGADQWAALAEAGLFAIPQLFPDTPTAIAGAVMEVLGRHGVGSQAAGAFAFLAVAPENLARPVAEGASTVSLGRLPFMPAAGSSDIYVTELENEAILLAVDEIEPVQTLSDENWVRVSGSKSRALGPFGAVHDAYDLAISAWLVGAGLRLLDIAAEHARNRRQFGQVIGAFQSVASPLARASIHLDSARILMLNACSAADAGDTSLAPLVRASANRAATQAALAAHQTLGALGMVVEGPIQAISKRVRQVVSQFPAERPGDLEQGLRPGSSLALLGAVSIEERAHA